MLSSSDEEPFIVVVQSSVREQTLPQTMVSPWRVLAAPHVTSRRHALASGRSTPPPMRWLPQLMCRFHGVGSLTLPGDGKDAFAANIFATCTAPRAFRNPAPCVRSL